VTAVREILDHRPAYRVPAAPEWFLGLTDVRGLSVPTVDFRRGWGLPPVEPTLPTRIWSLMYRAADAPWRWG
jgi:purine-binding chemotaxis protein CheW